VLFENQTVGEVPADCPVTETTMRCPLNRLTNASLEVVALSITEQLSGTVDSKFGTLSVQEYHW
jgi:hypothetical protein